MLNMLGSIGLFGLLSGQDGQDAAFMDGEAMVVQNAIIGFYRYDPAGMDQGVNLLHGVGAMWQ